MKGSENLCQSTFQKKKARCVMYIKVLYIRLNDNPFNSALDLSKEAVTYGQSGQGVSTQGPGRVRH